MGGWRGAGNETTHEWEGGGEGGAGNETTHEWEGGGERGAGNETTHEREGEGGLGMRLHMSVRVEGVGAGNKATHEREGGGGRGLGTRLHMYSGSQNVFPYMDSVCFSAHLEILVELWRTPLSHPSERLCIRLQYYCPNWRPLYPPQKCL